MQYNLDPLTGLPVIGGSDIVSQIPLGTQVVPWGDVAPSTLPQQGPAYPDDIINTFAWATGEQVDNPGVVRAATMTSDRRLRVDVGPSAAGGPTEVAQFWVEGSTGGGSVTTITAPGSLPTINNIYRVAFSFFTQSVLGATSTADWQVRIGLSTAPNGRYWLASGVVSIDASGAIVYPTTNEVRTVWENGIKLDQYLGAPSSSWGLYLHAGIDSFVFDLALDYA